MPIHALPPPPAIQVLLGAEVWAGDGELRSGQAVALRGDRILAAGPSEDVLRKYPAARRIELPGGTLLPGLIEGHAHVLGLGLMDRQADLSAARSLDAALAQVSAWAARRKGWVEGRGWDQNLWPGKAFPTARDLDAVTGDRPAALERVDGHALWVNSAALKTAGITRATPDPQGGSILRDAAGEPTGILVDAAADLVAKVRPAPS
ncbi:MAG: amidohydrolase family protein, partial [Holophaga sp.]|nr:amidohydrolase family protein [Holophaga sp.]